MAAFYPLSTSATHDPFTNPRAFDSGRIDPQRPNRRHGAVDLYTPHGTPVIATADGTVVGEGISTPVPYKFVRYHGLAPWVYAIELKVKGSGLVIRCAECYFLPHIKTGYEVHAGEQLGWVVRMRGLTAPGNSMLHFELYAGTTTGALSQPVASRAPYYRRADLLNPQVYLESCTLKAVGPFVPLPTQISALYTAG